MKPLPFLTLALGLLAAGPTVPASAADSLVLLVPPANRLVGLWTTDIHVSPAACTPGGPPPPLFGRNTIGFDAGGTLVENPQVSPPGVPGGAGADQLRERRPGPRSPTCGSRPGCDG